MRWTNSNKSKYTKKGYKYTNDGDYFDLRVEDLQEGSKIRVDVICDYCNDLYDTQYENYVTGRKKYPKDACIHCRNLKRYEMDLPERAKKQWEKLQSVCNEKGYILVTKMSEYTGPNMYIEYICPIHGLQRQLLCNIIDGHGCDKCAHDNLGIKNRIDIKYVKEYIESINGNKLLNPEEYIGTNVTNLKIQCSCGEIYITSLAAYKNGNTRCRSCSLYRSKGEQKIFDYLMSKDVLFFEEKRFDNCFDIHSLPFDFYLPEYNYIIEYDGEQHYYPVFGEESFERTKKHDKMKNEYCEKRKINLLRIPYWEYDNINEILDNIFKEIGKRYSQVS